MSTLSLLRLVDMPDDCFEKIIKQIAGTAKNSPLERMFRTIRHYSKYSKMGCQLYFPCVATLVAIKNETGQWKWSIFAACYTTAVAWLVSALVYQIGMLL